MITLNEIHDSLINGQRRQMVEQIKEYGLYDFWSDYLNFLQHTYVNTESHLTYYSDAVISYHHIENR